MCRSSALDGGIGIKESLWGLEAVSGLCQALAHPYTGPTWGRATWRGVIDGRKDECVSAGLRAKHAAFSSLSPMGTSRSYRSRLSSDVRSLTRRAGARPAGNHIIRSVMLHVPSSCFYYNRSKRVAWILSPSAKPVPSQCRTAAIKTKRGPSGSICILRANGLDASHSGTLPTSARGVFLLYYCNLGPDHTRCQSFWA